MLQRMVLITLLSLVLSGCITAAVATGTAASVIATDKRPMKVMVEDHSIKQHLRTSIKADPEFKGSNIVIGSYNNIVLLAGQTADPKLRNRVQNLAQAEPSVKKVYNEIEILGPSSVLSRSSDAWVTTKVKTALLKRRGVRSNQIKVITENGTVYLMGIVNQKQAALASLTTREVAGVQRVVTLFEISKPVAKNAP